MTTIPRMPRCPACGAKFSHDDATACCKECGLPDEISTMGPRIIARWKRKNLGKMRTRRGPKTKSVEQQREKKVVTFPAPAGRRRNKPGRRGVKA